MKRFLRRAACLTAMLLLIICPVKALAAYIPDFTPPPIQVGTPSDGKHSGVTSFGIMEVEKWRYLEVTVLDGERLNGIPGVTVKLYQGNSGIPITGSPGGPYTTDSQGKIEIQVAKDNDTSYHIEIDQPGFHHYSSNPFPISGKEVDQPVYLNPIRYNVTYHADSPGSIPSGEPSTESVRWGETPVQPPKVETEDTYKFSYWSLNGQKVDLSQLKVYDNMELVANYVRQYLVTYEANKYGYLDGALQERVTLGEKPANVPTPVPLTTRDYWFIQWEVKGSFSDAKVDPATVTITHDITFEAVFGVRKPQPVIIKTPPTQAGTAAPAIPPSTEAPPPGGPAEGPGGQGGGHGGNHKGNSGNASQALSSGEEGQPTTPGEESQPTTPGQESQPTTPGQGGAGPETSGNQPSAPASGQAGSGTHPFRLPWIILLCSLLTLVSGLLRLKAIHREIKGSGSQQDGEAGNGGESQESGQPGEPGPAISKAMVTEVIVAIICAVLWGSFYIWNTGPWTLAALAVWACVLLVVAVLLIRAEYMLRRKNK